MHRTAPICAPAPLERTCIKRRKTPTYPLEPPVPYLHHSASHRASKHFTRHAKHHRHVIMHPSDINATPALYAKALADECSCPRARHASAGDASHPSQRVDARAAARRLPETLSHGRPRRVPHRTTLISHPRDSPGYPRDASRSLALQTRAAPTAPIHAAVTTAPQLGDHAPTLSISDNIAAGASPNATNTAAGHSMTPMPLLSRACEIRNQLATRTKKAEKKYCKSFPL